MRLPSLAAACALTLLGVPAAAQDVSPTAATPATVQPEAQAAPSESADARAQATLDGAPPDKAVMPRFAIGTADYYFKPILALAGGLHVEDLISVLNADRESRTTTVAITRFGGEGKLGKYVSFRSEFERNLRSHGSGVWEGTASLSVRDQWLRLSRWGASVEAGIVTDPASVDYFSAHVADSLIADRYTRDPLLYSGFNRGQGVQASYEWKGLRAGLSFTAANPLSTTASFQFGGTFGGGSRLWERPLGNFRIGQPDDTLHFQVVSPSLVYAHELFEVKGMAQVFEANYSLNSRTDPRLEGYNLRGNVRGKLKLSALGLPLQLSPFFNVARTTNDVTNSTSGFVDTLLETRYMALSLSGGLDVNVGRSGIGVQYARVRSENPTFVAPTGGTPASEPISHENLRYLNVGATYWFTDEVALGARYARYWKSADNQADEKDASYFATLRLVL
jgi:hypothetical protein